MRRAAAMWGPPFAWAALIFALSARSTGGPGALPDWVTHGTAYAVLALLMARGFSGGFTRVLPVRAALLAVLLCGLYGVSDEYHQSFVPGRHADPWDVAKDVGGAALAAALWRSGVLTGFATAGAAPRPGAASGGSSAGS